MEIKVSLRCLLLFKSAPSFYRWQDQSPLKGRNLLTKITKCSYSDQLYVLVIQCRKKIYVLKSLTYILSTPCVEFANNMRIF